MGAHIHDRGHSTFIRQIKRHSLYLTVSDIEKAPLSLEKLTLPMGELFSADGFSYTPKQYRAHFDRLMRLEKQYDNLHVTVSAELDPNMLLYAKEDVGVLMAKTDTPTSAFVISERNMVNAFWGYMRQ